MAIVLYWTWYCYFARWWNYISLTSCHRSIDHLANSANESRDSRLFYYFAIKYLLTTNSILWGKIIIYFNSPAYSGTLYRHRWFTIIAILISRNEILLFQFKVQKEKFKKKYIYYILFSLLFNYYSNISRCNNLYNKYRSACTLTILHTLLICIGLKYHRDLP